MTGPLLRKKIMHTKLIRMKTKRKRIWMTAMLVSFLLAAFMGGCKKDDFEETPGVCPLVESTNPTAGAINVPLNQVITATFNEKMNPATITQASFVLTTLLGTTNSEIEGSLTYNEVNSTLSFVPASQLNANTTYSGRVKSSVKDLRGNALQVDYVWTFSTSAILSPLVIFTDPERNATNVVLNKVIEAGFNMPIDPLTLTSATFTVKLGATSIAGAISRTDTTVFFNPVTALAANSVYTCTLTTGVKNLAGIPLVSNYVWSFTTGTTVAPRVISSDPADNETGVALNKAVTATFSMIMDPLTINNSTFTIRQGLIPVAGTIAYTGTTATFTPAVAFTSNTLYTGIITTGAKNQAGIPLANKYVWQFTTIAGAPTVISTDPANLATDVVLNKIVGATFNMAMDPSTINSATFTLRQGENSITGAVSYANNIASFDPAIALLPNLIYTATITNGVKNTDGIQMANNYVWTFTTGTIIAPRVMLTSPLNNATGVALNKVVTATFNMAMDPLTLTTATFTLRNGATSVAGVVSYTGLTASFTSTADLLPGTVYTANITTGAKNTAGVAMDNNHTWTFTTLSNTAPTVISTDPANLATGVVLNKIVRATFSEQMNPLTLTSATFTLRHGANSVAGTVSYAGTTASFTPAIALLPGTIYTANLTTGIENTAGVSLVENHSWTFTTLSATAPTIISTDPANLATGVVLNKIVRATFSEQMNPLTLTSATFTLRDGANSVAGTVSYAGTTASFTPAVALLPGTLYTANLTTGIENTAGVSLVENHSWTFTTLTVTAPTVISTDPDDLATNVALNKVVSAIFSVPMNPSTLTTATFTLRNGPNSVSGNVTYSGTSAFFTSTEDLLPNTLYTANITTGVMSESGIPLAADHTWTFTTLSALAPMVTSTDPQDNDIDVVLNKTVTADFSMQMDPLTLNTNTFTLYQGSTMVEGVVSYIGTTASFNPTADLLADMVYTATITTGAMNLTGTPLENDFVWSFTTAAEVLVIVDLGTASMFGAFGGNAGITNQGLNSVINGAISTTAASTLVTGFHDGMTGDVYTETPLNAGLVTNGIFTAPPFPGTATSEAIAIQGLLDATDAYNSISPASMPGGIDPGAGELGGLTLAPGVYKSASGTFNISNGPLTLDAMGDPNAKWVFQTAAGLTVGIAGPTGARSVILINGALPKNVFWHVGSAATINGAGGGIMVGTIISMAGVTFSTPGNAVQTVLNGRAISLVASVTMVNTTINVPAE